MTLHLDYFYGSEAEQFTFYRLPKVLFTDEHFKSVSVEAKVLYGLLLDRMSLSIRNEWLDEKSRVYIYFTQEDAMKYLDCKKDKVRKLFQELDTASGIGLIERKAQGLGRPTRIYVKNFVLPDSSKSTPENASPDVPLTVPEKAPCQTTENSRSVSSADVQTVESPQATSSVDAQTAENPQSGQRKNRSPDCGKTAPNDTENNKTENNDTESSLHPVPYADMKKSAYENQCRVRIDEMGMYRELIRENLDYDILIADRPCDAKTIDGYIELMVEACCSSRNYIRIGGQEFPVAVVKSRFLKLNSEHIGYVLDSLKANTTLIKNIRAYTLTALYNAPVTMDQYYASLVSHDMARGAI